MEILFWASLFGLGYTYFGYMLLMEGVARLSPRKISRPQSPPSLKVSVVLVVHNGVQEIRARLENLLFQDYPIHEIVVVSDGSTDGTNSVVAAMDDPRVHLVARPVRHGKAACLEIGVDLAQGEIVVFADVRQQFRKDTVTELVRSFAQPEVGAVSGSLEIQGSSSSVSQGVGTYWNLEKRLRHAESVWDSSIGCTGAVYAIRRELFHPIPADTLLDDVVIPMQIALAGFRVLFAPEAIAYDPQSLDLEKERIRKRRTLAGNFQMLFRYPGWVVPWKNRLWWQLISHKYLRVLAPLLLIAVFISPWLLLDQPFYCAILWLQGAFYALGGLGLKPSLRRLRLFALPSSFLFLNWMVLRGLGLYLFGKTQGAWERVPGASIDPGERA